MNPKSAPEKRSIVENYNNEDDELEYNASIYAENGGRDEDGSEDSEESDTEDEYFVVSGENGGQQSYKNAAQTSKNNANNNAQTSKSLQLKQHTSINLKAIALSKFFVLIKKMCLRNQSSITKEKST